MRETVSQTKAVLKSIIRLANTDTYLILRRSATDYGRPLDWDLPGGTRDDGEKLEDAAIREIKEEVGLEPTDLTLRFCDCSIRYDESLNYLQFILVATTDSQKITLSYEHDQFEWVPEKELRQRFSHLPHYKKALDYIFDNNLAL